MSQPIVRTPDADAIRGILPALADILIDVVDGGAGVSFMAPLAHKEAIDFWSGVADDVAAGTKVLVVGEQDGHPAGTVILQLMWQPNQPHRGEVAKLLVHRQARRHGLARALMLRLEDEARARGRSLLVLDTVSGGAAERLYRSLGWVEVGRVPGYALLPYGEMSDTTFFYRVL
ncbi:MAG: GNAT family N-acetyltransferase [Hyphomicrobiaceae bacterium]